MAKKLLMILLVIPHLEASELNLQQDSLSLGEIDVLKRAKIGLGSYRVGPALIHLALAQPLRHSKHATRPTPPPPICTSEHQ